MFYQSVNPSSNFGNAESQGSAEPARHGHGGSGSARHRRLSYDNKDSPSITQ